MKITELQEILADAKSKLGNIEVMVSEGFSISKPEKITSVCYHAFDDAEDIEEEVEDTDVEVALTLVFGHY